MHARKLLVWNRSDTPQAVEAINNLNRKAVRLWMNLFSPSVKLKKKARVGSKLRWKYGPAQTPLDRVLASEVFDRERGAALQALRQHLHPFEISRTVDRKPGQICARAERRLSPKTAGPSVTF